MSFSLNEVEAMAKKAARGAEYSWGLSEEAAKATRWLCRHNIDGCLALNKTLRQFDGSEAVRQSPSIDSNVWSVESGLLCPVLTGTSLSDYALCLDSEGVTLQNLAQPSLLFFFAAMIAQQRKSTVSLQWPGTLVVTDGDRLSISGSIDTDVKVVELKFGSDTGSLNSLQTRALPAPNAWKSLNQFAHRTYAPESEQSRLSGAGSGLANDD